MWRDHITPLFGLKPVFLSTDCVKNTQKLLSENKDVDMIIIHTSRDCKIKVSEDNSGEFISILDFLKEIRNNFDISHVIVAHGPHNEPLKCIKEELALLNNVYVFDKMFIKQEVARIFAEKR